MRIFLILGYVPVLTMLGISIVSHINGDFRLWFESRRIITYVLMGSELAAILTSLALAIWLKRKGERKLLVLISSFYLFRFAAYLFNIFLLPIGAGFEFAMMLYYLDVMLFTAIPVFFIRRVVNVYSGIHGIGEKAPADPDEMRIRYSITDREMEVIALIRQGKTNRQIAEELFISQQTVKDHIYRIFNKTGVNNRVQLVNLSNEYVNGSNNSL
jgi:DNA-binding CsgD family transcriptional regulator